MKQDEKTTNEQAAPGEERERAEPHIYGSGIAMRMEDDPAGEGHMFTPGPDWPPARPDDPADEKDAASSTANGRAGHGHTRTSDDPEAVAGTQHDVIETSKPLDEP